MNESNQIIELLNNENTTFKNISYKSVNRTKLNNMNNNSFFQIIELDLILKKYQIIWCYMKMHIF